MRRMTYRLTVLAAVSGLLASGSAAAVTYAGGPLPTSTECVVQQVDERGRVTGTSTAREGVEYGRFRCTGGRWELLPDRFGGVGTVAALEIQVDPAGVVSAQRLAGPALSYDLTIAQMAGVIGAITGQPDVVIDRAIVATDDGRQRTGAEVEALLAGRDTTGVRVLTTLNRLDPAMTTNDIIGGSGGTPENTVVYFSIWGAIKRAAAWVVDQLTDAADWLDRHCDWGQDPDGIVIICRW